MENIIEKINEGLKGIKNTSAWKRGVAEYAEEIMDTVAERSEYEGHEPQSRDELIDYMLNGAKEYRPHRTLFDDWSVASYGGSYLIYDCDIAERLCTPSELKKTRGGERNPNGRESWLDVQARALFQAGNRILKEYRKVMNG